MLAVRAGQIRCQTRWSSASPGKRTPTLPARWVRFVKGLWASAITSGRPSKSQGVTRQPRLPPADGFWSSKSPSMSSRVAMTGRDGSGLPPSALACDPGERVPQRLGLGAGPERGHGPHVRLLLRAGEGIPRAVEDAVEGVIVAGGDGVVLVVVAAGAAERQAEERLAGRVDRVLDRQVVIVLGVEPEPPRDRPGSRSPSPSGRRRARAAPSAMMSPAICSRTNWSYGMSWLKAATT